MKPNPANTVQTRAMELRFLEALKEFTEEVNFVLLDSPLTHERTTNVITALASALSSTFGKILLEIEPGLPNEIIQNYMCSACTNGMDLVLDKHRKVIENAPK